MADETAAQSDVAHRHAQPFGACTLKHRRVSIQTLKPTTASPGATTHTCRTEWMQAHHLLLRTITFAARLQLAKIRRMDNGSVATQRMRNRSQTRPCRKCSDAGLPHLRVNLSTHDQPTPDSTSPALLIHRPTRSTTLFRPGPPSLPPCLPPCKSICLSQQCTRLMHVMSATSSDWIDW